MEQSQPNKTIRGYIMRMLARSPQNTLLYHQISGKLVRDRLIALPDIEKYLEYLHQKGYVQFVGKETAYTVPVNDGPVSLTAAGIDLIEGSIADPGVEI